MGFRKILIVEDDTNLAFPLKVFLEDNGFKVVHVISGEEAVEEYRKDCPSVVLLDVKLPGIDGFEVFAEIRKIDNSIPVIMMTDTEYNEDSQERGYNMGAICYMPKPVFPKAILARINSLLNPQETKIFSLGGCNIAIQDRALSINDDIINTLADKDLQVLLILLEEKNEIVPRKDLLLSVWKSDDISNNNNLDKSISKIKKVLKKYPGIEIKNIYSSGYVLSTKSTIFQKNAFFAVQY